MTASHPSFIIVSGQLALSRGAALEFSPTFRAGKDVGELSFGCAASITNVKRRPQQGRPAPAPAPDRQNPYARFPRTVVQCAHTCSQCCVAAPARDPSEKDSRGPKPPPPPFL